MAITITSEQTYENGVAITTPQIDTNKVKHACSGYNTAYKMRYVTVYTCSTTQPLKQVELSIRMSGNDGTSASKYLAMIITTSKNDSYLTTTPTFDTKLKYSYLRFDYTCSNGGSFVNNTDSTSFAVGKVDVTIPEGTFYIYILPVQGTSYNTFSTWFSKSSSTLPITIEGTEFTAVFYIDNGTSFDAYQCYIDNGTSWDLYTPYIDNGTSWDMY